MEPTVNTSQELKPTPSQHVTPSPSCQLQTQNSSTQTNSKPPNENFILEEPGKPVQLWVYRYLPLPCKLPQYNCDVMLIENSKSIVTSRSRVYVYRVAPVRSGRSNDEELTLWTVLAAMCCCCCILWRRFTTKPSFHLFVPCTWKMNIHEFVMKAIKGSSNYEIVKALDYWKSQSKTSFIIWFSSIKNK